MNKGGQWIIKIQQWYMAHPRGQWTKKPSEAYGYAYSGRRKGYAGAEQTAEDWRKYMGMATSTPPGMCPPGGFRRDSTQGRSVQVMRREDGLDLNGEPETLPGVEGERLLATLGPAIGSMSIMCVGMGKVDVSTRAEHAIARFVVSVGLDRKWKLHLITNGMAIDGDLFKSKETLWTRLATVSRGMVDRGEVADPLLVLFNEAYDYIIQHERRG